MRKNTQSENLSILLSVWVYIYALFYFVPLIIPSTTLLMYVALLGIDILVIINTPKIPLHLIKFLIVYVLITLINMAIVPYKYYVAIDSFSGLAVFLPALLIISSKIFDLGNFLKTWNKFAVFATLLSPLAILLVQIKIIDYGVFTYLNLPNSIIFSYMIISTKKGRKRKEALCFAGINFLIILFFGGRMAAFASAFSILMAYMLSSSIKRITKIISILVIGFSGILILNNLDIILDYIQNILSKYNLNSRSFSLLLDQIQSGGTSLYLTRRDVIYEEIINYISDRCGLPGGFGVSLNISGGQFYHPHNLFLQLAVMFGTVGSVLIYIYIIIKMINMKRAVPLYVYQFTLLLLVDYLVISFTGGSILNNFVAIIVIGMVFFYPKKRR